MNRFSQRALGSVIGFVILFTIPAVSSPAGAQFDGRWRIRLYGLFVFELELTQTGNDLSFAIGSSNFTGTVTGQTFYVSAPPGGIFPYGAYIRGTLLPDPDRIVASTLDSPGTGVGFSSLQRCHCDDGNSTAGDGCSCTVEPCYSCAGDPSVCTPLPDGAPCASGRNCMTGESCLGGTCGGGSPTPACVDLSGSWHFEFTSQDTGTAGQEDRVIVQNGSYLEHSGCAGTIDTTTGQYDMTCAHTDFAAVPDCPFGIRSGQAALDGTTLADVFDASFFLMSSGGCDFIDVQSSATRLCGDGIVQAGDQCDDGNVSPGDGCDANCHVEPCWSCPGDRTTCTPLPDGTRCGDGDDCTFGDACQAGACVAGTPLTCGTCEACTPLGTCTGAPRADCRQTTAPQRTLLRVHDQDASAAGDRILWKWKNGEATAGGDLADPLAGEDYTFCVFDDSGASPALLFRAAAPGEPTCGDGDPCWKRKSDGELLYRSRDAAPEGLTRVRVSPGAEGDAGALVRGKGALLSRADGLPGLPLPMPLRVQLQSDGGVCLEARFDEAGVLANDSRRGFSARAAAAP